MADLTAYPIIFSAPMVRAILREIETPGTGKTQTRRIAWGKAKGRPMAEGDRVIIHDPGVIGGTATHLKPSIWQKRHDKFHAGERPWLWVKEKWQTADEYHNTAPRDIPNDDHRVQYDGPDGWRAWDLGGVPGRWRSPLHMPKWASRLSLRFTDMRMERLQDISDQDAIAEGIDPREVAARGWVDARVGFRSLWDSIHGDGAWAENPEIVVTTFEPHLQNIGSVTDG